VEFTDYDTRLAAYAVIVDDSSGSERVLLALWNEAEEPRWTLPGGGVELRESPEEGAVREVREESGYDVELTGLLGVHSYVVPPERRFVRTRRPMRALRVIFSARVVGGELTREIGGTTDEARWFPLDEVAALPQVGLVEIGLEMWRAAKVRPTP
jgi:8-oxo-dGTP diphosphatase